MFIFFHIPDLPFCSVWGIGSTSCSCSLMLGWAYIFSLVVLLAKDRLSDVNVIKGENMNENEAINYSSSLNLSINLTVDQIWHHALWAIQNPQFLWNLSTQHYSHQWRYCAGTTQCEVRVNDQEKWTGIISHSSIRLNGAPLNWTHCQSYMY